MMGFSSLSILFWSYALESACYVLNEVLNKFVNKISYEIWTGCKSVLLHLRVWGCLTYVKHLKINKLGSRSDTYLFIGYPKEIKGYYFCLAEE